MFAKQLLLKTRRNAAFKSFLKRLSNNFVICKLNSSTEADRKESLVDAGSKMKKASFTKNLFVGLYDPEMLIYPEVLDADSSKKFEDMRISFEEVKEDGVGDNAAVRSKQIIKQLKTFSDTGLCSPFNNSLAGLTATECLRMSEFLEPHPSVALLLELHYSFVMKTIIKYGSALVKEKYLAKLMTGEWFGSYALYEVASSYDPSNIETTVTIDRDTGILRLAGQKLCLVTEPVQFFIVFAKSQMMNRPPGAVELSAFIVDKNENGIKIEPQETSGLEECQLCKVTFNNVIISKENMLAETGEGFSIASDNFSTHKFIMSACVSGSIKKLIKLITSHLKSQRMTELQDSELLKKKIAAMGIFAYTLDSMLYLTAGIIDKYEMDTSLESAIVQAFSYNYGLGIVSDCLDLVGILGYKKDFPCEKIWQDLRGLNLLVSQPCDTYKLYVSLTGLQHAGNHMNENIKKTRNPFNYPSAIFKRILSQRQQNRDTPKLEMELYMQLHPSLKLAAQNLEYCVLRLQFAVETLLIRHGANVINRHLDLLRLSETVFNIYAMTSVLSRASRSYCTGLLHSDLEVLIANTFCQDAYQKVKCLIQEVIEGNVSSNDVSYIKIGDGILQNSGYFFEHPLKKNIN